MAAFLGKEVRTVIIYISNDENKEMLNQLAAQYEWELLTEVMNKGSLNSFIKEKLQLIGSLQYLVLDRDCIRESDRELKDVIETIHVVWDTRIILLMEELTDDKGERQKVIYGEQITYLYKYQDNLVGNLEYLLRGEKIPAEEIYEGIWIGVMSANSGAGATHVSIGIANFIRHYGESVCYVEANESGDLGAMAAFYGMDQVEEGHYQREGVDYWHQSIDPEKKFAVLDLGKYSGAKLNLFNQCRVKILVTDGKPYRMADALNVLRYIGDESTKLWLNFTNHEEYERIRNEYLDNLNHGVGSIGWHKEMFQCEDTLYQEALSEYISVNAGKQKGMSYFVYLNNLKDIWKRPSKELKINPEEIDKRDTIYETDGEMEQEEIVLQEKVEIPEESFISDLAESDTIQSDYMAQEPEPAWNDTEQAGDDREKTEEPETLKSNVVKPKKRIPVKINLVLFLIAGIAISGTLLSIPGIKQFADGFHFNIPDTEQTTELVDDKLNINPDIKISVLEVEGADGYEVSYSTDETFDKKTTVVVEVETLYNLFYTNLTGKKIF